MNPKFIVIDTNALISAVLSPNGIAYQAFAKARQHFILTQTNDTYQEISERIYKTKFDKYISNQRREEFLTSIRNFSQFIQTTTKINDCRDADDNKFLELAQDSNAQFLITGDKDLLTLTYQPKYQNLIISPRDFLEFDLSKL